jgi:Peptidase family C25
MLGGNMSTPVSFTPQSLDFGSVSPGSMGPPPPPPDTNVDLSGGVFLDHAPAAKVAASLSGNTAGVFKIASVAVYRWVSIAPPPPGHGPPHTPFFPIRGEQVLELVATGDGTTPLAVAQGQFVLVSIRYTAPAAGGAFGATLLIAGDNWTPNPVQVPLSLSLGGIATHLGATSLTIPQGASGDLPIVAQSLGGPDTDVIYTLNTGPGPQGVSLQPLTVHVPHLKSVPATLHFTVSVGAPIVNNQTLWIQRTAFGGSLPNNPIEQEPLITIAPGSVFAVVQPPGIFSAVRGRYIEIPIRIGLGSTNNYTAVSFAAGNLPQGVAFNGAAFVLSSNPEANPQWPPTNVGLDGTLTATLQLAVGNQAVSGIGTVQLNWFAFAGTQTGTLTFDLDVEPAIQLLVVAPAAFESALMPFMEHKIRSGVPSRLLTLETIRSAFNGIDDPERIKRAIYQEFQESSIRFVLLVGDAQSIPVRYRFVAQPPGAAVGRLSGWMDGSYCPTDHYYACLQKFGLSSFDNWDANGDGKYNEMTWSQDPYSAAGNPDGVGGLPDVAVGRVPAGVASEVEAYVNKVIQYETGQASAIEDITFVADHNYPNAEGLCTEVANNAGVANVFPLEFFDINLGTTPPPNGWTAGSVTAIDAALNLSRWLIYIGHGSQLAWDIPAENNVNFDPSHVQSLANTTLPVVFAVACSTGYFAPSPPCGDPDIGQFEYLGADGRRHWYFYFDDSKVVVDVDTKVAQGVCPKDNQPHTPINSGPYCVDFSGSGAPGQAGWKWCQRCYGMFYAGNGLAATHCSAAPQHDPARSGDYTLNSGTGAPGQNGWRWCVQCQGLFFGGSDGGSCPATPGAPHKASNTPTDYAVKMRPNKTVGAQLGWCWCEKCQGLFYAGSLGQWDVSHPPGIVIPPPAAYDFVSAASRTFAYSWLFSSGGAIAYFGENEVMEDQNGTALLSYMLAQYAQGARSLGTIWHKAHQQYFQNFAANPGGMDPNFTPPRIYLGIMEMFGDPSLRLR